MNFPALIVESTWNCLLLALPARLLSTFPVIRVHAGSLQTAGGHNLRMKISDLLTVMI